jgi:RNA polymerase sigma-70 factor (ECF subfamily)
VAQPQVVPPGSPLLDLALPDRDQLLARDARKRKETLLGDSDDAIADDDDDDGAASGPAAATTRAARAQVDMERALGVLSEAERAAIVQCYHNDLSHEEAAFVLGCPVGTVKTHVHRAKQKLKVALASWAD